MILCIGQKRYACLLQLFIETKRAIEYMAVLPLNCIQSGQGVDFREQAHQIGNKEMASLMQRYSLCICLVQVPPSSIHNKTFNPTIVPNLHWVTHLVQLDRFKQKGRSSKLSSASR